MSKRTPDLDSISGHMRSSLSLLRKYTPGFVKRLLFLIYRWREADYPVAPALGAGLPTPPLRWTAGLPRIDARSGGVGRPAPSALFLIYRWREAAYPVAPCFWRISSISASPNFRAQARGVAHGSSSGRLIAAPRLSRN